LSRSFVADGKIHRCGTANHPRSLNGAYWFDGQRGWCMRWGALDVSWWNSGKVKPFSDAEKKQWADKRRMAEKAKLEGYAKASSKASQMLSECVIDAHAYLKSKQLPESTGMINSDGHLLIPMRDCSTNKLNGVQSICLNAERDGFVKKFLPGMKAKGSVFKIGSGKKIILVEGYATGLSVHEAASQMRLDVCVMCCFSASNMVHVAKTRGHYVMADADASKTGEKAAIDTGLPWLMPESIGMDWNDVHAKQGIFTLCAALKKLYTKI
jgi:putative DNA primase/helicase